MDARCGRGAAGGDGSDERGLELLRLQRDLAVALGALTDPATALQLCLEAALKAAGMEAGGVYLEEGGALVLQHSIGLSPAFTARVQRFAADTPNAALVLRGQPVYLRHAELIAVGGDEVRRAEGLSALAVVPIVHQGRVLGSLNLATRRSDTVPEPARHGLEAIAGQLGSALDRIRTTEALRRSEERFRGLFAHMPRGIAFFEVRGEGEDFLFEDWNPAAEQMNRVSRAELLGRSLRATFPGLERAGLVEALRRVHRSGDAEQLGDFYFRDQHRRGWRESLVFKLPGGELVASFADVTARKEAEQRRDLAVAVLELLNQPAAGLDLVREIVRQIRMRTGLDEVDIRLREGASFPLIDESGLQHVAETEHACLARGGGRGDQPAPTCLCGEVLRDEPVLRATSTTSGGSFWTTSVEALLASTDGARLRRCGGGPAPASLGLIPLRAGAEVIGLLRVAAAEPGALGAELITFLEHLGASIGVALGRLQGNLQAERHAADLAFLARSAVRLLETQPGEDLWEVLGDGLHQISGDALVAVCQFVEGRIVLRSLRGTGSFIDAVMKLVGRTLSDGFSVRLSAEVERCVRLGRLVRIEGALYQLVNGELPELVCRAIEGVLRLEAVHAVGFVRKGRLLGSVALVTRRGGSQPNLPLVEAFTAQAAVALERHLAETERAQFEEQARHSQKLEALGTLAGGVAHDFNNLLTVILSATDLALKELPGDAPLRGDLEEIHMAGKRAEGLTRKLLAFSRRQVFRPEPLELGGVVRGLEPMLRRLLGEDVEVRLELAEGPTPVLADRGQLEQVVVNLATNARDAMPRGGRLTVRTQLTAAPGTSQGSWVALEITDTGQGMDATTRKRAMEPFFTTKEVGRGTGLGLPTVYGIVEQSGGHLSIESAVDKGTRVVVKLPLTEAISAAPAAPVAEARGGQETILVVEDDEAVRRLTVRALAAQGYTVLQARDASEALRLAGDRSAIHLLLTDVVMPGPSGAELARDLRARRPELRVLFMSGYPDRAFASRGLEGTSLRPLLPKPFTSGELVEAVRRALDEPARA